MGDSVRAYMGSTWGSCQCLHGGGMGDNAECLVGVAWGTFHNGQYSPSQGCFVFALHNWCPLSFISISLQKQHDLAALQRKYTCVRHLRRCTICSPTECAFKVVLLLMRMWCLIISHLSSLLRLLDFLRQGHRATGSQGHRVMGSWGHGVTGS